MGLTGGMGAGKSTVISHLRGLPNFQGNVFDCDAMVHKLYRIPAMRAWLEEKFGEMPEDARGHCAQMVTANPLILPELEKMFIAAVKLELREWIMLSESASVRYVIVDAPLLFETHMDAACNSVVVIHCPEDIRRPCIMERPGMTEAKMNIMLSRQLSDSDRLALADHIIKTDTTLDETFAQVAAVHEAIRSRANGQT